MKACWKILFLSVYLIFLSLASVAQCGTLQTVTYDTTVTGNGNNNHVFSLSRFDPSIGTLVSAKINSVISLNYGFTLKNVENVERDFSVAVGRYDNFSSAALSTPNTNLMNIPLGSFPLAPDNTVSHPPSTVLSGHVQSDSLIYDMVNFLGSGNIEYNYTPITYTNLTGSNVYYYSAVASDTIHFSITYFYCTATVLPISITDFFAKKEDLKTIHLSWETLNEIAGRTYEIQKSEDGNTFTDVNSETSLATDNNADYLYDYKIKTTDKNKMYFRIKMTNLSGAINYSEIREVNLNNNSENISVYPNPSSGFINVDFDQAEPSNWQINIYSTNGILVQSNNFQNATRANIKFSQMLARGIYFIRCINQQTQKNYIVSFNIR